MRIWTVDDVMSSPAVSVRPSTSYRQVVRLLLDRGISAVPVVDDLRHVVGVVSETDLLRNVAGDSSGARRRRGRRSRARAVVAAELMSSPAVVVVSGTTITAAARLLDGRRVRRLPVVDGLGRLAGLVTRGDLLKVHRRSDGEIGEDVRSRMSGILLAGRIAAVCVAVDEGVVRLTGHADRWSTTDLAARRARQVPGVVRVIDELGYDYDDRQILAAGSIFSEV